MHFSSHGLLHRDARNLFTAVLVAFGATLCTALAASPDNPRTWPERFSRSYYFERQTMGQLTLDWEGIRARRFFLVLDAEQPFTATLVRERDSSMLFHGRRASHYESLIDWGVDEVAQLSVSTDRVGGLRLTMRIATDPRESGRQVYSFQVNRFLHHFAEHDVQQAESCLVRALEEDPADSTAALLLRSIRRSERVQESGAENQP